MHKTLYSREYQQMLKLLQSRRTSIQVSQTELARRLNWSQVDISKCETGVRRLDVIELKLWIEALGILCTNAAVMCLSKHEAQTIRA